MKKLIFIMMFIVGCSNTEHVIRIETNPPEFVQKMLAASCKYPDYSLELIRNGKGWYVNAVAECAPTNTNGISSRSEITISTGNTPVKEWYRNVQ